MMKTQQLNEGSQKNWKGSRVSLKHLHPRALRVPVVCEAEWAFSNRGGCGWGWIMENRHVFSRKKTNGNFFPCFASQFKYSLWSLVFPSARCGLSNTSLPCSSALRCHQVSGGALHTFAFCKKAGECSLLQLDKIINRKKLVVSFTSKLDSGTNC